MIVGDVFSNLGNQLFIYAATKCIAMDLGFAYRYRVIVPSFARSEDGLDEFKHEYSSRFEAAFGIDASERIDALPEEVTAEWEWTMSTVSNYDASVYESGDNTRLHGYFQSPRYFEHHRAEVKKWFAQPPAATEWAARRRREILDRAGAQVLCGVHVRRGADYKLWNLMLGAEYYRRAVQLVAAEHAPARVALVLFSDVPKEAGRMPGLSAAQVSGGSVNDDLCLMTACDSLVIANSTLSWWGAWLGEQDRLIVRPSVWPLTDGEEQPLDVFPASWTEVAAVRDVWRPSLTHRSARALASAVRRGRGLLRAGGA